MNFFVVKTLLIDSIKVKEWKKTLLGGIQLIFFKVYTCKKNFILVKVKTRRSRRRNSQ